MEDQSVVGKTLNGMDFELGIYDGVMKIWFVDFDFFNPNNFKIINEYGLSLKDVENIFKNLDISKAYNGYTIDHNEKRYNISASGEIGDDKDAFIDIYEVL